MKLLIDSSAWIEHLTGGPRAKGVERYLKPPHRIVLPAIVTCEIYRKVKAERGERTAVLVLAQMERLSSHLVPMDQPLAVRAADVSLQYKLPMADAMIYAAAISSDSNLLTMDAHFKGLPGVQFISPGKGTAITQILHKK